jgi:hypothetical protein
MKRIFVALVSVTIFSMLSPAQEWPRQRSERRSRLWKVSLAVLAASTAVDAASSWGRLEANPLLRSADGRFGIQGVSIKLGVLAGVAGAQYMLLRNHPKQEKYGAFTNFAFSAAFSAAAISNYQRSSPYQAVR